MPSDLQQTYIRRQQKSRAESRANIVQTAGIAILVLLLSAILIIASAKYGVVSDPDSLILQPY
jgi:hypothetical protein